MTAEHQPTADELDKEQLSQLHAATLKASDSCFELKKLCATVLIPGTALTVFAARAMGPGSLYIGFAIAVIVSFWLADGVAYYYQRKLRNAMSIVWQRRAERSAEAYEDYPRPVAVGAIKALFNSSMYFYLILAVVAVTAVVAYELLSR